MDDYQNVEEFWDEPKEPVNKWMSILKRYGIRGFHTDGEYTPDRSRLQAKFLNNEFASKLMKYLYPSDSIQHYIALFNEKAPSDCRLDFEAMKDNLYSDYVFVDFESDGQLSDVQIDYCPPINSLRCTCGGLVERSYNVVLKPVIGDDYPVLIHQMQAMVIYNTSRFVFVYDRFEAQGLSEEEFLQILENVVDLDVKLVSVKQIESVEL